ncbi:MAG: DUF2207 domain-containing protein [Eubacterium sp.]
MKKIGRFIPIIFIVLTFIISSAVNVAEDYIDDYNYDDYGQRLNNSYEYHIDNYRVDMKVQENNTVNVTEHITTDFNVEKHGIYRYIPIKNHIQRADGSSAVVKAKVSNVDVDKEYSAYTEGSNYVIQIGDEDVTLTGEQEYTISYTYNIGRDLNEDFDELYYNIIGDNWDTYSKNVSFSIEMPKEFDQSKLGFSAGVYGTEGNNNVNYTVDGNTISGSVDGGLDSYEALTVRLELEEGYFSFNYAAYAAKLAVMVVLPLIALAIIFILWSKYGKDKKIVDVVEFYPPEGINSAEAALWYNGSVTSEQTVGILLELANEGYIDIAETEKGNSIFGSSKDYRIVKKKNAYDGQDELKLKFFNGLFKSGLNYVYISDLEENFYTTANMIVDALNDKKEEIFHSKSLKLRFVGWAVSVISAVLSVFVCCQILGGIEKIYICAAGVAISVIAFIISFFIRQRTDEGHELKQKINGFKLFLETAEKEKLELLVEENPEYFYNVLPFAYTLGVSDKWIKNFEGIVIPKPDWYNGQTFTTMTMYHFMHSAMPMAARAMTSEPKPVNNGSSSGFGGGSFSSGGGGFAGGGFGGGGGRSW